MIPFEDIERRLKELGKDRVWLASESGRKPNSIRVALAPNADEKNRSPLLQRALSEAIEAEEGRRQSAVEVLRSQNLVLEVDQDQFDAWNAAALASGELMRVWAVKGLDRLASEENVIPLLLAAEEPAKFGEKKPKKGPKE